VGGGVWIPGPLIPGLRHHAHDTRALELSKLTMWLNQCAICMAQKFVLGHVGCVQRFNACAAVNHCCTTTLPRDAIRL